MSDYETSVAINTMAIEFLKMKNEAFWAKVQGYGATLRPNKFMLYLRPDVMDFVDFDWL